MRLLLELACLLLTAAGAYTAGYQHGRYRGWVAGRRLERREAGRDRRVAERRAG